MKKQKNIKNLVLTHDKPSEKKGKFSMITLEKRIKPFNEFYLRYKRFFPAVAFLSGFIWDACTLRRVDNPVDIAIFGLYLCAAAGIQIIIGRAIFQRYSHFFPFFLQFFFGGLFSGFVVYYFKSSSSIASFLFMLVLVGLLVGNEFLEQKMTRCTFTLTQWGVCCVMYLILLIPILVKSVNAYTFLLSIVFMFCFAVAIKKALITKQVSLIPLSLCSALLVILYFSNIIPPVPLSLKTIRMYHSITKTDSLYLCRKPHYPWYSVSSYVSDNIPVSLTDTMFCFASVFAPTHLKKNIVHTWYYYNSTRKKFEKTDKRQYTISGSRDMGYRGYTFKKNIAFGQWKVVVSTIEGSQLGSIGFTLVPKDSTAITSYTIEHM